MAATRPAARLAKPAASKPASPAARPARPAASKPARPAARPAKPAVEPAKPAVEPAKPAVEPAKPAVEPAKRPARSARLAAEPAKRPARSARPAAEPAKRPARSARPAAEPAKRPARSARPASGLLAIEAELRAHAMAKPFATEHFPWGERAIKVKGKVFLFMRADAQQLSLSTKLPESAQVALLLPFATPTGYGLGKAGWVSASFSRTEPPPVEMLCSWIDESYQAIAPAKLARLTRG